MHGINENNAAIISNCFNIGNLFCGGYDGCAGGILGRNTNVVTINNSYSIGSIEETDTWGKTKAGIIGSERGTSTINKCYYLKTEGATQGVNGIEDSTIDVVQCTSVSEITADILNENITTLTHEEEWKTWEQGEEYPIIKLK